MKPTFCPTSTALGTAWKVLSASLLLLMFLQQTAEAASNSPSNALSDFSALEKKRNQRSPIFHNKANKIATRVQKSALASINEIPSKTRKSQANLAYPIDSGSNGKNIGTAGDPVNVGPGSFWKIYDDFPVPFPNSKGSLPFSRGYTARSATAPGDIGPNWRHNFETALLMSPGQIVYWIDENGGPWTFRTENGVFVGPPAADLNLIKLKDHFELTKPNGSKLFFSTGGALNKIVMRDGSEFKCSYDSQGRLEKVTSLSGESLTFTRDAKHLITSVTKKPDGKVFKYAYQADTRLSQATDPSGQVTKFTYVQDMPGTQAQGSMASITTPDGKTIKFTYYPNGDAFQQIEHDGKTRTFTYFDNHHHTEYKETDGSITHFYFDDNYRTIKEVRPDGSTIHNTWTNGKLTGQRIELAKAGAEKGAWTDRLPVPPGDSLKNKSLEDPKDQAITIFDITDVVAVKNTLFITGKGYVSFDGGGQIFAGMNRNLDPYLEITITSPGAKEFEPCRKILDSRYLGQEALRLSGKGLFERRPGIGERRLAVIRLDTGYSCQMVPRL